MSVLLIPNPTKDTGLAVTRQAAAVLAGLGRGGLDAAAFANEFGSAGLTGGAFSARGRCLPRRRSGRDHRR